MNASVLIVDDNPEVAETVAHTMATRGYDVRTVSDGEAALSLIRSQRPGVLVTELEMPGMDGIRLCQRIRETSNLPIIVISDRGDGRSEVAALDAGADDYLARPFGSDRFLARVRAALRRSTGEAEPASLSLGDFQIDFHKRRVVVGGRTVRLTPKEFDLFVYMARHPNRVIQHRTLLTAVWGQASEEQSEYLRVFIGQLRKKLEPDPANPRYLTTEPWVGYRFNPGGLMQ
jgi:two-component system KDP operon response regulator KdpE